MQTPLLSKMGKPRKAKRDHERESGVRPSGEDQLIAWLRRQPGCSLIGNDAATLPPEPFAVTTDTQIAGVHVAPDLDPAHTARRLVAVNASDLAAMGAVPAYAFLVLAAPRDFDHKRFLRSVVEACRSLEIDLAGGDLAHSQQLVTTMTLLGRRNPEGGWLRRDRARPGNQIWVGGTLGESCLGFRALEQKAQVMNRSIRLPEHLRAPRALSRAARQAVRRHIHPTPQLQLGSWLARRSAVAAAIDVSDGLARDLHRLCRESGVGAEIDLAKLPASLHAQPLADRLRISLNEAMLFGGEDYILCFTLPDDIQPPVELGCVPIGQIREKRGIKCRDARGRSTVLPDRGFDHLTTDPAAPPR